MRGKIIKLAESLNQPNCYMKTFMGLDVEIFIAFHSYFKLLKCKARNDARHTELAFREFDTKRFPTALVYAFAKLVDVCYILRIQSGRAYTQ